jgi:hypothetical protein
MINLLLSLSLTSGTAFAQGQARLIDGQPEFGECLGSSDCENNFTLFLGHALTEQGFTFQQVPQLTSSLNVRHEGFTVGLLIDTFPLAPPRANLSGKEENTDYSPVIARLTAGWLGQGPLDTHIGAGAFFFWTPVDIGGATVLIAGADLSASRDLSEKLRAGVELDFTYTRATAPIVASKEQYENRDEFDNPDNILTETYEEVCLPQPNGCIDTYTMANTALRLGVGYQVIDNLNVSARLGLTWVRERLDVDYDRTTWVVSGLQPNAHLAGHYVIKDRIQLGLGTSLGFRRPTVSEDGQPGIFYKFQAGFGVIL